MPDTSELKETIRIQKNLMKVRLVIFTGKDGEFYVTISPSANISGYGKTKEESHESFNENVKVFCEDLLALPQNEMEKELLNLGFHKERLHNKNFSKLYVDEHGDLKNFEAGTVEIKVLETTACL